MELPEMTVRIRLEIKQYEEKLYRYLLFRTGVLPGFRSTTAEPEADEPVIVKEPPNV